MNRTRAAEEFFGEQERAPESSNSGSTLRAFGIGTVLCVLISTGTIYANCIIKGSFMAWAFSTPVALFLLFYLVLANIVVKALARTLALRREELTLIYVMMIISASLPTFGMVSHLLPMITNVFYFASPENNWAELIQPHVPSWIAPHDEEVIQGFYEGLFIKGQPIPYAAWVGPLCYWTLFLLALYLVSICMMVMMRRQWVEHERLLYPMMQAPMAMVEEDDENAPGRFRIPSLLRRPQMWMGFAVPLVVITCNAFHSYYPMIPEFNLATGFNAFRGTVGFRFQLSFSLLGFSYFISRELALGIWVFYLLTQIQQGVFNTVGIQSMAKLGWFSNPQAPYLTHQALGAMLMFALLTLWRARSHLRDVFGRAFGRRETAMDADEIMSYRTAVLGLVGGVGGHGGMAGGCGHSPAGDSPVFSGRVFDLYRVEPDRGGSRGGAGASAPDSTGFCHRQSRDLSTGGRRSDWAGLYLSVDGGSGDLSHGLVRQRAENDPRSHQRPQARSVLGNDTGDRGDLGGGVLDDDLPVL